VARVHNLLERVARQQSTLLMGIVNVTPNSFYDGGRYEAPEAGRQRVVQLLAEGADILDIGAESSKPGAPRVSIVSVDTASPSVAEAALERGAHIINDVTCLSDPELASVVARHDAYLILSHARAHQSEMAGFSEWPDDDYSDVVADVLRDLDAARAVAEQHGVRPEHIWYDPGLGFSKNARHTIDLLSRTAELVASGSVVVVGASRKSFIRTLHESAPEERLGGTLAASLWAARAGAQVLRVHDVAALRQALLVEAALLEAQGTPNGPPSYVSPSSRRGTRAPR